MFDTTHIALALHDCHGSYWPHVAVMVTSVCQHTTVPVVVHLLHDETLNDEAGQDHGQMVSRYGLRLEQHAVSNTQFLSELDFRHLRVTKFCSTRERSDPYRENSVPLTFAFGATTSTFLTSADLWANPCLICKESTPATATRA
jgi:hypothetical protein